MENTYIHTNLELEPKLQKMIGQLYQWSKGEYVGDYSRGLFIDQDEDLQFLVFEDERRINIDLMQEFLIPVNSEDEGFIFTSEVIDDITKTKGADGIVYEIPGPDHGKKVSHKTPKPRKVKSNPRPVEIVVANGVATPKKSDDPIISLIDRTKKEEKILNLSIKIDTINLGAFSLITSSFEDSEEIILDYLYESLDKELFKEAVKDSIKKMYKDV